MKKNNKVRHIVDEARKGMHVGIPSFCTSNEIVIEAILMYAAKKNKIVLIESTANQVNQDGGYTGMKPSDFSNMVFTIAKSVGCPEENIILGGDHLGPLPWSHLHERNAMEKAKELIQSYVAAGYKKIHLDTSMYLGDDRQDLPLSTDVVASRGVELYQIAEREARELYNNNPSEIPVVYVIGSEVPVPGGNVTNVDNALEITTPCSLRDTIDRYNTEFSQKGNYNAWENIIAVVVQPGVEFGNMGIIPYNHDKASNLVHELDNYPGIVFEGHSTDYQDIDSLTKLVSDKIAILKVGPALTNSLRNALYSLSYIEDELFEYDMCSHFVNVLDEAMVANPIYWEKYYSGTTDEVKHQRKHSIMDRSRYYLSEPNVKLAIKKLFTNIDSVTIPRELFQKYMPYQYYLVMNNGKYMTARELVIAEITQIVDQYYQATCPTGAMSI